MKIIRATIVVNVKEDDDADAISDLVAMLETKFGFAAPVTMTCIPGDNPDDMAVSIDPLDDDA